MGFFNPLILQLASTMSFLQDINQEIVMSHTPFILIFSGRHPRLLWVNTGWQSSLVLVKRKYSFGK